MSRSWRYTLVLLAACGCLGAGSPNGASPLVQPVTHPVTATLIAEHTSIQSDGQTRVGVLFEIAEGWHIYAQDPGDAGLPTKVKWSGPTGIPFGPLQWPKPIAFVDPGNIRTFGYKDHVLLISAMTIQGGPEKWDGAVSIHADVSWLACHEICLPGKTALELTLPVSPAPPTLSKQAELFAAAK